MNIHQFYQSQLDVRPSQLLHSIRNGMMRRVMESAERYGFKPDKDAFLQCLKDAVAKAGRKGAKKCRPNSRGQTNK